jgi:2-dehydro-3-deoxyglucarate aldolase/4-hydroxy-2-oxoheptanedioate aldolase
MVGRFLDYGYTFAAVASDLALMTGRANDWLAELRKTAPAAVSQAAY